MAIDDAHNYVVKADEELVEAIEEHKSGRKKQICICVTLMIVLVVVLTPVLLAVL